MSPRSVWLIAVDVLREALFSRYLIVLFGFIAVGLGGLALSLDLDVVDGAIAGGKLFGGNFIGGRPELAGEFLRPVFQALAFITFYFGHVLMIMAVADIAPKMFAAGRVELLLSLPLRRAELVLGTYLGVMIIAGLATTFAVGGASIVLFAKTGLTTFAPVAGAAAAFVAFMTCYSAMLLSATIARSAALSAASGFGLFIAGIATSDRAFLLTLIRSGTTREIVAFVIGPLPRFKTLGEYGADFALGTTVTFAQVAPVVGGCLAIVGFAVVIACGVVHMKDY